MVFTVLERRSGDPLPPGRLLRSRARLGGYLTTLCVGGGLLSMFFLLSQFLQRGQSTSPLQAKGNTVVIGDRRADLLEQLAAEHTQ